MPLNSRVNAPDQDLPASPPCERAEIAGFSNITRRDRRISEATGASFD
jgi:hypothetical protein